MRLSAGLPLRDFGPCWRDFVQARQGVQGSRVSYPRQQLRDDIEQDVSAVADVHVAANVSLHLRVATAEGNQDRERDELPPTDTISLISTEVTPTFNAASATTLNSLIA